MPKGGARPNSGRKTKASILGLDKMLEDCVTPEDEAQIWATVKKMAKEGSIAHAQLYLNYKYGKPKEMIEQKHDGQIAIRIIRTDGDSSETA